MSDENYDEWRKKSEKRQTREARITSTKPSFSLSKPQVTITVTLESPYLRIPSKTYPATTILSYPLLHLNDEILWSFPSHYHCCNSFVFRFLFHHTAAVIYVVFPLSPPLPPPPPPTWFSFRPPFSTTPQRLCCLLFPIVCRSFLLPHTPLRLCSLHLPTTVTTTMLLSSFLL